MPPERWTIMLALYLSVINWLHNEEGQDLAEYGLLLGFLAVVVMIAVALLGDSLLAYFNVLAIDEGRRLPDGGSLERLDRPPTETFLSEIIPEHVADTILTALLKNKFMVVPGRMARMRSLAAAIRRADGTVVAEPLRKALRRSARRIEEVLKDVLPEEEEG